MTYDQFIKELSQLDAEWGLDKQGRLRCAHGDCPITAVARAHNILCQPEDYATAAHKIELNLLIASQIVNDADDFKWSDVFSGGKRNDLLKACGLA